jgi:hypothetical protein
LGLSPFLKDIALLLVLLNRVSSIEVSLWCSRHQREQCTLTYDTGASRCITGNKSDFVQLYPDGPRHKVIKGIVKGLDIEGEGIVEYTLTCDDGTNVTIRASVYFVPA